MPKHYLKHLPILLLFVLTGLASLNNLTLFTTHTIISSLGSIIKVAQAQTVSPPINLAASITQKRIINLSWNPPADVATSPVSGYIVYRDGVALTSTSNPITVTGYTYSDAALPGSYCFTVVSSDSSGTRSEPASACVSIVANTVAVVPIDLTATTLSSNQIRLAWRYPLSAEQINSLEAEHIFLFIIERSNNAGSTWSNIQVIRSDLGSGGSLQFTFTDTNAVAGGSNMYRITAFDDTGGEQGWGFSAPSNVVTVVTAQVSAVPNAPTDLRVSLFTSATSANLSFKDNSNDETGWVVERLLDGAWVDFSPVNPEPNSPYNSANTRATWDNFPLMPLSLSATYNLRVRAINSAGRSEPSNIITITTPSPLSWTQPVPSQHMLIVYNADDTQSASTTDYYLNNRPGVRDANVLGLHFPALGTYSHGFDAIAIDKNIYQSNILTPITDWLQNHPNKPIRYIVMMWGMPLWESGYSSGIGGHGPEGSIGYKISTSLQKLGVRNGYEYKMGQSTRYTPDYYRGTTALVTYMNMGSYAATIAYIDKLNRVYNGMTNKNVVLSARDAGVGGDTYYIEYRNETRNALLALNPSPKVEYKDFGYFDTANNVLGYSSEGTHTMASRSSLEGIWQRDFIIDGHVRFSGNSDWYIMRTIESFNGQIDYISSSQSSFSQWFSANAFGGTDYKNTPVGAIAHISEPAGPNDAPDFFTMWERGYLFAEAAWATRNTIEFLAIGDPLVANTGTARSASNVSPTVNISSPANTASFTAPATITINANASDSDGTISKVEFYNGNTLLNSDSSSPYSYTWNSVAVGTYSLTAKAYDNSGASKISSVVTVTVSNIANRAPTANAGSDQTITLPNSATLSGSGTDPDGQTVSYSWSKVSGVGTVTFSSASVANPTATFGTAGTYTLRLTVSDGSLTSVDDVTVVISSAQTLSTKFSNGSRVQVNGSSVNVRATPATSGTLLGSQTDNAVGTIIGSPTFANDHFWWNVNYDSGVDGYSVEDYLINYIAPVSYNVSVQKIGTGEGTVTGGGVACGSTCSISVIDGTPITLTASPVSDSIFTGWSGGGCSGTGSCTVLVDSVKTVTATFNLTSIDGSCGLAAKNYTPAATFPNGAYCSLGTVSPAAPSDPTSSLGSSWSCQGTNGGEAASCNATRSTDPIDGLCGAARNICTTGTLSDDTYSFTNYLWKCIGSNGGTQNLCSLPKSSFTLTVVKSGSGTITSNSSGISCGSDCSETVVTGTSVTLTPLAAAGFVFAGWSGACSGTGSCTVLVDSVKTVQATFNDITPPPPIEPYVPVPPPYVPPPPPVFYTPLIVQQADAPNYPNYSPLDQVNITTKTPTPKKQTFLPAKLTKNLKINGRGPEVLLLQRTLNLLGYTIATTGPQSLGNETSKFDKQTEQALIRYQNNYAESGVTPTGVLDNVTMSVLNGDINRLVSDAETAAASDEIVQDSNGVISTIASFIGTTVRAVVDLILGLFR